MDPPPLASSVHKCRRRKYPRLISDEHDPAGGDLPAVPEKARCRAGPWVPRREARGSPIAGRSCSRYAKQPGVAGRKKSPSTPWGRGRWPCPSERSWFASRRARGRGPGDELAHAAYGGRPRSPLRVARVIVRAKSGHTADALAISSAVRSSKAWSTSNPHMISDARSANRAISRRHLRASDHGSLDPGEPFWKGLLPALQLVQTVIRTAHPQKGIHRRLLARLLGGSRSTGRMRGRASGSRFAVIPGEPISSRRPRRARRAGSLALKREITTSVVWRSCRPWSVHLRSGAGPRGRP